MVDLVGDDGFQYGGTAEFGAWGAVFIDTHVHGRPEGRVESKELSRLESALQAFTDRPILVCLHHPPLPVGSTWLDGVGLRNAGELLAVIERYPTVRAVLGGTCTRSSSGSTGTRSCSRRLLPARNSLHSPSIA